MGSINLDDKIIRSRVYSAMMAVDFQDLYDEDYRVWETPMEETEDKWFLKFLKEFRIETASMGKYMCWAYWGSAMRTTFGDDKAFILSVLRELSSMKYDNAWQFKIFDLDNGGKEISVRITDIELSYVH